MGVPPADKPPFVVHLKYSRHKPINRLVAPKRDADIKKNTIIRDEQVSIYYMIYIFSLFSFSLKRWYCCQTSLVRGKTHQQQGVCFLEPNNVFNRF